MLREEGGGGVEEGNRVAYICGSGWCKVLYSIRFVKGVH